MGRKTTSTETGNQEDNRYTTDKVCQYSPGLARLRQKLGDKARKEPKFRFYSLYAHICHIETLRTAWYLIRQHGQTPGVDNITYEDIEDVKDIKESLLAECKARENVEAYIQGIQKELRDRTYKPMPVRRVYIPKADGKKRPLGIPTIKDRLVQMAVLLIIEPIFEEDFLECSYGFRPGRSAHEALQEIARNLQQGRTAIYDADLKGYFDSIPHDKLMQCIRMRITDGAILKLIEGWLKAPIVEKEKDDKGNWKITVTKPAKGTPQGGVISPLLANVYLHWFDKRFHAKDGPHQSTGAKLVRYADDFVVMAKHMGGKITGTIQHLIEGWLGLEINKEKTKVVTLSEIGSHVDFLGYTFRVERCIYKKHQTYIRIEPKKKSVEKARDKIRELTSRDRSPVPIKDFVKQINSFLTGWQSYFKLGHPKRVFGKMDYYVEKKVIRHLQRRSQRGYKKPKGQTWYRHLRDLGLVRLRAG